MTFYEFFCGAGMARAGLGPNWTCQFANDIDPKKGAAYAANWGEQGLVVGDVADLKPADLPCAPDLVWMSPPCQDLSEAGQGAGLDGKRSGAFRPCAKLLQAQHAEGRAPKIIAYENVTGLLSERHAGDFAEVCDAFTELSYRFGALVVDGSLFVTQSRPRVFMIGVAASVDIPTKLIAAAPCLPFHPASLLAALRRQKAPALWWRLPVPPTRNMILLDVLEDNPPGFLWDPPSETAKKISMMDAGNLARLDMAKCADKRMVGGLYRRTRGKADKKRSAWEVRFDGLAGCLRMPTGGSSILTIVIVDGDIVRTRRLSAREAARLMGVGEDYALPSNYLEAYGLMADGVVVPVVRFLAEHILQPVLQASVQADPARSAVT
jgi:DNA (cytosine-5)-methyltransferase 1